LIKCNECGLCKESCPVFRVVKRETLSPRGFAIMKKEEKFDKLFYLCSLCNNCKVSCPYGVDLALEETRAYVAKKGEATKEMQKVIGNLRETGNPYGIKTKTEE
jgi:Fe-S oxidoreductase